MSVEDIVEKRGRGRPKKSPAESGDEVGIKGCVRCLSRSLLREKSSQAKVESS